MNTEDIKKMALALQAVQEASKKKLDPVGKETADIDNDGDTDKSDSYLHNRRKAVSSAIKGKGTKETVTMEDFDQIDELSKKTLGSYVKKADKQQNPDLNKVRAARDSGGFKAAEKEMGDQTRKAKNRTKGVYQAIQKYSMKNEEAEQLDELSKKTLGSYVAKASSVAASDAAKYGQQGSSEKGLSHFRKAYSRLHNIKKAAGKLAKEEVDQLDEISKKTLGAYSNKSHDEFKRLQQKGGASGGSSVMNAKQKRRYATGSDAGENAFKKLTGRARVNATESFDLSDFSIEELKDFMMSEDFDQLDELSKKTLGSYVKKASNDLYFKGQDAQYHTNKANTYQGVIAVDATRKKHNALAGKATHKASNRDIGIERAVSRLAKEEVEQIDELKRSTLKSYIKKANSDKADHSAGRRDATNDDNAYDYHKGEYNKRKAGLAMAYKKANEKAKGRMEESRWPIYNKIQEARDEHLKGATSPEAIDSKASQGEKNFVKLHGGLNGNDSGIDGAKAALQTAQAALAKIKPAAKRIGDNTNGDKSIIKSTEAK